MNHSISCCCCCVMAGSQWNYLPSVIIFQIFKNLQPQDRLRASATCKSWRQCIYQNHVWPSQKVVVNVNKEFKYLYHSRRHHHHTNTNIKDLDYEKKTLKLFISKCGRFIQDLKFIFNPSCSFNVNLLIDLINLLSFNTNNDNNNNGYVNCQRLSRITFEPTTSLVGSQTHNYVLMARLLSSIEILISRCQSLEHISLGCLQQLLNHSPSLLTILAQYHCNSIKCIYLASIKEDPDYYPVLELPSRLFEPFLKLQVLTIDFDNVTDDLLQCLSMKGTLKKLIINVHGIDEQHQGVSKSSWSQLARSNPGLEVTVNLVHTDDSVETLKDMIFDTDMPLTHFRAYYAGMSNLGEEICDLMNLIAIRHSLTLLSATLVHYLKQFTSMPNTVFATSQENPLVMLAWRCKKLQHLTVIGMLFLTIILFNFIN